MVVTFLQLPLNVTKIIPGEQNGEGVRDKAARFYLDEWLLDF